MRRAELRAHSVHSAQSQLFYKSLGTDLHDAWHAPSRFRRTWGDGREVELMGRTISDTKRNAQRIDYPILETDIPALQERGGFEPAGKNAEQLLEDRLSQAADIACRLHNIEFARLSIVQKKFVTHYRCTKCGYVPLYLLDAATKRMRCGECGQQVSLKNKGKYGPIRREVYSKFKVNGAAPVG